MLVNANQAREKRQIDQASLADDLLQEQTQYGPLTEAQKKSLQKIQDNGLVVVTSQQPGLLGGPLYVYFKALTCLKLAQKIEEDLSKPVVPLFWITGEDSDLKECNLAQAPNIARTISLPFEAFSLVEIVH